MSDVLRSWADQLVASRPTSLRAPVIVTGERDHHLGPRWEFAKLTIVAEPAERFEIVNEVRMTPELEALRFPEWAIYGVLDVLMVAGSAPLTGVRLTLKDAGWNPVDSSAMAFRQAGRDAGRKIAATMT